MGKRKFSINFEVEATIELDDAVISAVDDEWRSVFYDLNSPEAIAEMVGMALIMKECRLSDLDGFADQPNSNARILEQDEYFIDVKEIFDENKK